MFNEGERIKEDQARAKSQNPGVTADNSIGAKTIGTGALKNPAEAEAAAASGEAPNVEPKKELKEKKTEPKEAEVQAK